MALGARHLAVQRLYTQAVELAGQRIVACTARGLVQFLLQGLYARLAGIDMAAQRLQLFLGHALPGGHGAGGLQHLLQQRGGILQALDAVQLARGFLHAGAQCFVAARDLPDAGRSRPACP